MSITFKPVYTIPPFPTGVLFEGIKDTSRSGAGNRDIIQSCYFTVFSIPSWDPNYYQEQQNLEK